MICLNVKTLLLAGLFLASSTGMVNAEANYHDVVRDTEGQTIHSTNGNCVRTKWITNQDCCCDGQPQYVAQQTRSAVELTQEERTVYFQFNRSVLSPGTKRRLDTLVNVLKSNQSVKEAKIVGYADRIGSVSYNDRLSQKRAETVRDYLIANGYTNARVTETRWVGESEPSTNCSASEARPQLIECLQKDRRVEVEIEYLDE